MAIRDRFARRVVGVQAVVISAMGSAGVALFALQPKSASGLAAGAAVWLAVARLPPLPGVDKVDVFAVTLEPAGGVPAPTGLMYLAGKA